MDTLKPTEADGHEAIELSATESALISAVGKALAVLGAALEGGRKFETDRFADMLALFGTVAPVQDIRVGLMLACWADIIKQSTAFPTEGQTPDSRSV